VLTITSANFHAGEVAIAYSPVTLLASGGVPPYSWSIRVGALPTGLSAAAAGTVSGTPSAAATYTFTVHVADTAGQTAIVNRSVTVVQHVAIRGICTTTTPCAVEAGCVICGRFGALSGGVGPFKYALVGTLPSGMGLSGLSLTGPFPPPPVGIAFPPPVRFQLTVTDSLGATGTVLAQFTVFNHLLLPDVTGPTGIGGITASMPYSGGAAGTQAAKVVKGSLPPGSTYSVDSVKKVILIQIPQQPITRLPTLYVATFQLSDQALCGPTSGQLCSTTGTFTISIT
jgi:large repetitive protein